MICLINARLIDGTGAPPVEKASVLLDGEIIKAVGTQVDIPEGTQVIDLKGATLLPGLTEAHIHFGGSTSFEDQPISGAGGGNYEKAMKQLLDCGITNARGAGDYEKDIMQLRDDIAAGKVQGPRIWVPGRLFQTDGGHPGFTVWMSVPETVEESLFLPENEQEAAQEVYRQADIGVDHIKMALSDVDYIHPERVAPKLSPEMCRAIVDAAHEKGLRVMVHGQTPQDSLVALQAGVDTVEHLVCAGYNLAPAPEGLAEAFLKNDAYVVPTMACGYFGGAPEEFSNYTGSLVKELFDKGVKIATGTDSGTPGVEPGKALLRELQLLVQAGIPPMKVLEAATRVGAEIVGSDRFGIVREGKLADLVAVDGDPLEDMSNIEKTLLVIKEGQIVRNYM